jgi:hypothetical protein
MQEIDRVLARHHGFTDEELERSIKCDIKYHWEREAGKEREE